MTSRILAAIDLSEPSRQALREARDQAALRGGTLAVCHVLPDTSAMTALFPQTNQPLMLELAEFERKARELVHEFVSQIAPGQGIEIFVDRGEPSSEIVRRAESWNADRIVLGSRGSSGLSRALLGSVAGRVVRYAHCQVLIVRSSPAAGPVLAATDLSDPSIPAITAAAEQASLRGAPLIVAHAMNTAFANLTTTAGAPFGVVAPMPSVEMQHELRASLLSTLQAAIHRCGASGEAVVLDGPPGPAIIRAAEERGAQLLVVGTRGRTGLSRILLGSVAETVISEAGCSVLAVRLSG